MSLELALRNFLLADPGVAAIVGNKIFPQPAPQDTVAPFITWLLVSADDNNTLDGPLGLRVSRVQIDCWSDPPEQAGDFTQSLLAASAVRQAMKGFTGMQSGLRISSALPVDARDIHDDAERAHARSVDFRIWHQED